MQAWEEDEACCLKVWRIKIIREKKKVAMTMRSGGKLIN